jgi:hypothetical protein
MRRIHKVCTWIRRHESVLTNGKYSPCLECPKWEKIPPYGKGTKACRVAAEELVNVVKTGNPWGKGHCVWPTKRALGVVPAFYGKEGPEFR